MDKEDFKVHICRGSSYHEIAETLLQEGRMEVGVTESLDIYISHQGTHWAILEDSGVPECDFVILGNVSLGGVGLFMKDARIAIVRFKSNQATREFVVAAQSAIIEYLKPLRSTLSTVR